MRRLSERWTMDNLKHTLRWPYIGHSRKSDIEKKKGFGQVRKFLREAEENGESEDLNGKGAGPADDKCFLCQKVMLMVIMMLMLIMLIVVLYCRNDGEGTTPLCQFVFLH